MRATASTAGAVLRRIVLTVAAVATMAAVLAPAAIAGPVRTQWRQGDPVERSILAAAHAGTIDAREAIEMRSTWRSAGRAETALARRGSVRRASEIAAVRAVARGLAARRALTPRRVRPAMLTIRATTWTMMTRPMPGHEDVLHLPGEAASFKYYSGRGVQFQPFETLKDGLARATWMRDEAGARRIADRMIELSVRRRGMMTWEYGFPYEGDEVEWASAISQAIAIDFYQNVADGQEEPAAARRYAGVAASLLDLLATSVDHGGVAADHGKGRWYLLYSHHPSQRVLNSQLQVILSVYHYYEATASPRARFIINQGILAVTPMLPRFDTGAWSRYQPGQEADLGYHDLHVTQLTRIGRSTELPQFQDYAHRFSEYRSTPPTVTVPNQAWGVIIPPLDGRLDAATIRYRVSKRSHEVIRITDPHGTVVRRLRESGPTGPHAVTWDGRTDSGRLVRPGRYTVWITATDIVGNARTGQLTRPIVVDRDTAPPVVHRVRRRSITAGRSEVVVRASDAASAWIRIRVVVRGRVLASRRARPRGTTRLVVGAPSRALRGGWLLLDDSSGNLRRIRIP